MKLKCAIKTKSVNYKHSDIGLNIDFGRWMEFLPNGQDKFLKPTFLPDLKQGLSQS